MYQKLCTDNMVFSTTLRRKQLSLKMYFAKHREVLYAPQRYNSVTLVVYCVRQVLHVQGEPDTERFDLN